MNRRLAEFAALRIASLPFRITGQIPPRITIGKKLIYRRRIHTG